MGKFNIFRFSFIAGMAVMIAVSACTATTIPQAALQQPVPVAAVSNARTALASYQAALGLAQVALRDNPALLAKVNSLAATAAPYVAAVSTGVDMAAAAPSLGALAAEMLVTAAPYITAVPNGK